MTTRHMQKIPSALAALGFAVAGCATQPTPHLVDARRAYDEARTGYANDQVPDEVYEAKMALEEAERAHERNPGSDEEKHLAYVAHRKAMMATTSAQAHIAMDESDKAVASREKVLLAQRNESRGELEDANEDLDQTRAKLTAAEKARTSAEKTAAAALATLNEFATITAEEERVVITLSGEVMFKTNDATLLPLARSRLDQVAAVLKDAGDGKKIMIAGHTDSRGRTDYNSELSRRRADAVRSYLVGQGVPEDMIGAVGKGENEPIADNRTAEGRANNRRVEIIIDETGATRTSRR